MDGSCLHSPHAEMQSVQISHLRKRERERKKKNPILATQKVISEPVFLQRNGMELFV